MTNGTQDVKKQTAGVWQLLTVPSLNKVPAHGFSVSEFSGAEGLSGTFSLLFPHIFLGSRTC